MFRMKNNRTNSWILWTILIIGILIVAGCGNGNPTTPDPSDVHDFSYDDGGLPVDDDMDACLAAYNILKIDGGGTTTVVNDSGYILIGAFESWSGQELDNVRLLIHENDDTNGQYGFDGKIALTELAFPITISVHTEGYVAETIVATSANVIALGLERHQSHWMPALIVGYTFDDGYRDPASAWAVGATGTHQFGWELTTGGGATSPYTQLLVNPYQPVGGVAFLYEFDPMVNSESEFSMFMLEDYDPVGYSYSHIGSLDPGSVGGWILNLNEEGAGTDRGSANYTITHVPVAPDPFVAALTLTPCGIINDSQEFIPYYLSQDNGLMEATGQYSLTTYDPPALFDRDVIHAYLEYWDGSTAEAYVDWTVGGGLPDITFADVPVCNDAKFKPVSDGNPFPNPNHGSFQAQYFNTDWDNVEQAGYQLITFQNSWGDTLWEIRIASDATSLPVDTIIVPQDDFPNFIRQEPSVNVTRVTSPGFDIDEFTVAGAFAATTNLANSTDLAIVPDLMDASDGS